MSVIRPDFYNFGKVVQPQEALKRHCALILRDAHSTDTATDFAGVGAVPGHVPRKEVLDVSDVGDDREERT